MQDNILFFLAYCFLAVILINIINNSKVNRIVLFVLSIGFYLISDYKYLILLVGSTLWGYFLAPLCKSKKKWFLWLSLVPLIIVLFIIKWSEILISRNILLPLGLSYYFFKIISYEIDVYSRECEAEESFIDLCNYVFFFPQIVCGPIARISDLRGQLTNLKRINEEQFEGGFYLVVFGLFKKVVLADRISPYVNSVFADSNNLSLEMNDTQRRAIIDIVEIAKSNGIDITFLEIPQYVPVNEANIYDEIRQKYCDLLKDLEVEYILADVIGFDCSDAGCYQDLIHLSSTGRTKYTTLLTDYLNYGIE